MRTPWYALMLATLIGASAFGGIPGSAHAERIKDITSIAWVRSNQLVGY